MTKFLNLVLLVSLTLVLSFSTNSTAATLATDCTLFASASGNDANSGLTPSLPKTFSGAASAANPGAVICVMGGTYNLSGSFTPPRSGTSSAYITYEAYGDSPANFVYKGANVSGNFMFNMDSGAGGFGGFSYLKFIGLNLDGQQTSHNGFFVRFGHHVQFLNNYVKNTTGAGIACNSSDYCIADHNLIWHNGEGNASAPNATSGIAFNILCSFDSYTGFHDVVSNNIVSADEDTQNNSDGNGIIMDTNCTGTTSVQDNNPPELVINNVVFMNSGECIANFAVSRIWTVNNSCYKNSLNTDAGFIASHGAEFGDNASELDFYVNNIAVAWQASSPPAFSSTNGTVQGQYFKNMYVGGLNFTPNAPSQFFHQDPLYRNPPTVGASADFQWRTAPDPATIGTAFQLQAGSPAIGKGVDPSTLSGVPSAIVSDLRKYVYKDIDGNVRQAGSWDLGAYQSIAVGTLPAPPTGLTGTVE